MQISQKIGNIYTGSIFSTLVGLLISDIDIKNKNIALFSYGSGVCSTLMTAKIHDNILSKKQIDQIKNRLSNRIKIAPEAYDLVMAEREKNYGHFHGILEV
jgi:hydroxymethylglutaryl-CoA synthase